MNNVIDRRNLIVGAGALVVSGLQTGLLFAEGHTVHEVMMYNKDPADSKRKMVFTPDFRGERRRCCKICLSAERPQ